MQTLDKLKSRKLWVAVATGALVAFATELGLTADQTQWLVITALTYMGVEGAADFRRAGTPTTT